MIPVDVDIYINLDEEKKLFKKRKQMRTIYMFFFVRV